MKKLFGTDGVRGVANMHPLTSEMALQIGRATAYIFKNTDRRHRIVIGKDTRLSGYMLEQALASGICSMGVDVLLVGPLPTPAIAFMTTGMRADAGMVISASHNPYQDNGIKIFSRNGYKLPDQDELEIEELIFSGEIDSQRPTKGDIGKAFRVDDAQGRYIEYCKNTFPKPTTLEGMRIVLDCANGAAYKVAPVIFTELGAEVISFGVDPDGENINKKCGALYPELISAQVKRHRADIGIALDGDADRVAIVDEHGSHVDGDQLMAIMGLEMLRQNRLKKKTIVGTVMSNMALELLIKERGGKFVRAKVGDRYVVEEMRANDYNFGGEQSGHLIFRDYATTGDGIISAIQLLGVMKRKDKKLSSLARIMKRFPQVLINIPVREKIAFDEVDSIWKTVREAEKSMKGKGRVLVRYSGTELLARVMVEGRNKQSIQHHAQKIANAIKRELG